MMNCNYDMVILGAGHHRLLAAADLARAGLLLVKNESIGGANTSQQVISFS